MAFSIQTYAIAKKYTDETAAQFGGLKGASCKIASITKSNGRNVVTFEWKNDEGETRTSTMNVDDGTPIYTWTAGDSYKYGDLVIYASCFYRCITPNSDVTFDDTKWNEIGSPDGNYDIIQDASQLPERFTEADRKMYYSIEDGAFWLWDGTQWVLQENGGGKTYTAGKYINIDANNEISVDRVVPNEAFIYTIQQIGDGIVTITKTVNGAVVFEETYNGDVNVTLDALQYVYNSGVQSYTLLIASDTHEAGFKQVMSWWQRNTFVENFSTVDHSGEKLIIKSEMDTALASKADTSDLANKQDVLTEGTYIDISSNTISVQRDITHDVDEVLFAEQTNNGLHVVVTVGSTTLYEENFVTSDPNHTVLDLVQTSFNVRSVRWILKYLKASKTQSAGYETIVWPSVTDTFVTTVDADKKLIIQSELDTAVGAVSSAVNAIKDGQSIDSFSDVETALSGKQASLTAGKYIDIDANNEISVEREIPNESFTYNFKILEQHTVHVTKTINGAVIFEQDYTDATASTPIVFDDAISFRADGFWYFEYELLIDSESHSAGFKQRWSSLDYVNYTENFTSVDNTGKKLIIKSELDAELNTIKDGTSIDSFGDVETALADKQNVLLYGGVNPPTGADGDMYVKLVRDESTLIDMFGSPSAESTDEYEMSYTVDSSVMGDYYDYEAFGTGKGFGQNGRGAMTITYHFKKSKFKPANVSYCNNFNLSGGGYLESAHFTIKASNDGTNWDTLYSTNTACPRDTSVSADITANTYYSYFKFEMYSDGGYTGIRNIAMNGISESYSNIDNIYFKNDGTWLKDAFAKKSEVDAIKDGTSIDSFGDVETALASKQGALNAGDYISITNDTVAVNRNLVRENIVYDVSIPEGYYITVKKSQGGATISTDIYRWTSRDSYYTIDDKFKLICDYDSNIGYCWTYLSLVDSISHEAGYTVKTDVRYATHVLTEEFSSEDLSGYKLVIKSEMDSALSGKQDTLTFDDVPTDNSNNPVKSNGIYDALALKQNATDNSLETEAKTIVGAINEHEGDIGTLKSGLTNLDNEVNGDAVEYPYADVITIPDAVPANLADCSVKIEPVQDLHGQSAPYVGGAGKNKFDSALIVNPAGSVQWVQIVLEPNTVYTVSSNIPYNSTSAYIFAIGGTDTSSATSATDGVGLNMARTVTTDNNGILSFAYRNNGASGVLDLSNYNYQIEAGSTATDYAPYENICPITGHTEASVQRDGKNLFDEENANWKSNYYIDENGQEVESLQYKYTQTYIPVEGGSNYVLSIDKTTNNNISTFLSLYNKNKDIVGYSVVIDATSETKRVTGSITLNSNVAYVRINTYKNGAQNIQFEKGSTATPYEPYAGKTYTIALGDTIYGGTVDFDSGVMTVDRKYITFKWSEYHQTYDIGDNIRRIYSLVDHSAWPSDVNDVCNVAPMKQSFSEDSTHFYCNGETAIVFLPEGTDENTDIEICYKLATSFTVQLTPQQIQLLKGTNTLTASTGQISVTVNGVSESIGAVQEQVNDHEERIEAVESLEKPSNIIALLIAGSNSMATTLGVILPKGVVTATIIRVIPLGGSGVDVNFPLTVVNYDNNSRGTLDGSYYAVGSDTLLNIAREYCTQVNISLTY